MNFEVCDTHFKRSHLNQLAADPDGRKYLFLRSMSRREMLEGLARRLDIELTGSPRAYLRQLFESEAVTIRDIEQEIRILFERDRAVRRDCEEALLQELYLVNGLDWGGLFQNSLEKTIVNNYIKRIRTYGELLEALDTDLTASLRAYVCSSWYNHWTSIIIEDVFKEHPSVLPAVGLVKQIDFFVAGVPFDLKVTFLPEGFIKEQRTIHELRPELTVLRQVARRRGILIDQDLPEAKLLPLLWQRVQDDPDADSRRTIAELRAERRRILGEAIREKTTLIRWLYENQGERRFDASNRLFLILSDSENYFDSWRLKRQRFLIAQKVTEALDAIRESPGVHVEFEWEGVRYEAVSDAVFITPTTD